ncbi:MAG: hypothetical protein ABI891_00875 [Acidobacteriota bacterium]
MSLNIKKTLLFLLLLFSFSVIEAQEKSDLPISPIVDDEWECGLTDPPLVEINVSAWSSKKGDLKDLNYKDFEVYDEKEFREIEYFKFDELKNQYTIGFHQDEYIPIDKWRNVKVKIKLSEKMRKDYGKISVRAQKGYYPANPKH